MPELADDLVPLKDLPLANVASKLLATPLASRFPETTMPSSGEVMFIIESVVVGSALVSGSDAGCAEHRSVRWPSSRSCTPARSETAPWTL